MPCLSRAAAVGLPPLLRIGAAISMLLFRISVVSHDHGYVWDFSHPRGCPRVHRPVAREGGAVDTERDPEHHTGHPVPGATDHPGLTITPGAGTNAPSASGNQHPHRGASPSAAPRVTSLSPQMGVEARR